MNFADESGMRFNVEKCNCMVFGLEQDEMIRLEIGNDLLKIVNAEKHIGHVISSNGDIINYFQTIHTYIYLKKTLKL